MDEEFALIPNLFCDEYDSAVCGPRRSFQYKDEDGVLHSVYAREVKFLKAGEEQFPVDGIWVGEEWLEVLDTEDDVGSYRPGNHVRTIETVWCSSDRKSYSMALVEYIDRLQIALRCDSDSKVLYSNYFKKIHLGTLKQFMDEVTLIGASEIISKLKELSQ